MVERVNGTIKKGTILKENYADKEEMNSTLIAFLVHYMLYRRHGSLRKEHNVKTPFNAIEKPVVSKAEPWFELKHEIFNQNPLQFKNKILSLQQNKSSSFHKQRCGT